MNRKIRQAIKKSRLRENLVLVKAKNLNQKQVTKSPTQQKTTA